MSEPLKDSNNTPYYSPNGQPAATGVQVTVLTPTGPQQGTMVSGGYVVPNK